MAFLFKSKKHTDKAHTVKDGSAGTSSSPTALQNGNVRHNDRSVANQSTPGSSVNNSITSLQNGPPGPPSPEQINGRRVVAQEQAQDLSLRNATAPIVQPIHPPNPISYLYPWSQVRLTFVSAAQSPFPRYGAAVNSAASKDGCIYLMGGLINSSIVRGDLWMVEAGGKMICYPVQTTAEGPGPRVGHAGLLVGNAFIVYGGDTKIEDSDILDETLYLLNTSTRQWSKAKPAGPRPAGRYGHTLNILGSKIYIFGGQVEGYFMNDLVAFDLNQLQVPTNRWEMLIRNGDDGGPAIGTIPAARTNHSIVTYNEKLYLFGGTNGYQWFNDVWCYNPTPNTWTSLECIGYIPAPREGHAAAIVDDVMYIFGGRTEDGSDLGDLAAFRITSRRWYTFQNMGPSPSPRSGHSMTAHGGQIIVLGGEPSTATRESNDLTIAYILDTNKIRYPNDYPAQMAPSGGRRPSISEKALPSTRALPARDASAVSVSESKRISGLTGRGNDQSSFDGNSLNETNTGSASSQVAQSGQIGSSSKLPRATGAQMASSPPQHQAIALRSNSITPTTNGRPRLQGQGKHETGRSASIDITTRNGEGSTISSSQILQASKEASKEPGATNERKISSNQNVPVNKSVSGEPGPPVSMNTVGSGSKRSSSRNRFHRQQGSIDSTNDQSSLRNFSAARQTSPPPSNKQIINPLVRKGSARNSQTVSVLKELDAAKSRNAWYASELELARKAGYTPTSTNPVDHKTAETFDDEDKPLIEALIAMKTELANVQGSIDTQAVVTAKKIAEIENQRDSAIREAVYAKAKLAAHSGIQSNTPPPEGESRDLENVANNRSADISRKLATMLSEQSELHNKIEMLNAELEAERRSSKLAEEIATSSQDRLSELEAYKQQNSAEVEHLKAELHDLQVVTRKEAIVSAEAVASMHLLKAEKEELEAEYQKLLTTADNSKQAFEALNIAVKSTVEIRETLERQLEYERCQSENLASQLATLRSEYESCKSELEKTTHKLRDTEELAEKHALENRSHLQAIQSGLNQLVSAEASSPRQADQRITVLQAQVEAANKMARDYQAAADSASEKLRRAEERIAGLEVYQEQTSREGMSIRKQLQNTMREIQTLQAANNEMKYQIANQQLETNAVHVQHNTLKEILDERGMKPTSKPRSQSISSPSVASDTFSLPQIRELEQQLSASIEAHEETKQIFEAREQEAERAYREKLAQLENDYQSAVKYVKGTEKMLKRLNDELAKYKSDNIRLKEQFLEVKEKVAIVSEADEWKNERSELHGKIESLQDEIKNSVKQLEHQMAQVREDLLSAEKERDTLKVNQKEAQHRAQVELQKIQNENSALQQRAQEAEQKVSLLLDQVEQSVDIYRRHSRPVDLRSLTPTATSNNAYQRAILTTDSASENSFDGVNRNSMALDSLASELETLRSHWQNTNKNYRLSNAFDFDDGTALPNGSSEALNSSNYVEGMSGSLANWRKKLDSEEANLNNHASVVNESIRSPVFAKREMDPSEVNASHGDKGEINAI